MNVPLLTEGQRERIACIARSYRRLTRRPLVSADQSAVEALWCSPLAIVSHGIEADPIFYFGNRMALALFEMDFANFTRLPSRLSAEPLLREERAHLLDRVARHGIIEDYAGVRISATGKRFRIANAAVWNVTDEFGAAVGQAAAFSNWTPVTP